MSRPSSRASGVAGRSPLAEQVRELLVQLDVLPTSEHDARQLVNTTTRTITDQGGLRNEWNDVHYQLEQLARKYRITSPADKLAQALKLETDKLDSLWHARSTEDDRDAQVKALTTIMYFTQMENLPAHVAFLLALSNRPDDDTRQFAANRLNEVEVRPQTDRELYDEIMAEAAAEDEAGEGDSDDSWVEPDYGSHGSAFDSSDADDSASLQSMSLDDFDPVGGPSSRPPSTRPRTPLPLLALASAQRGPPKPWKDPRFYFDKDPIDYSKVYGWRSLLKMPSIPRYLDICDNERAGVFLPDSRRYIYETDCLREMMLALVGLPNLVFEFGPTECTRIENVNLLHVSPGVADSLLGSIADVCTALLRLRTFAKTTFNYEEMTQEVRRERNLTHATVVAFAGGIQEFVWEFDRWVSEREMELLRALNGKMPLSKKSLVGTVGWFEYGLRAFSPTFTLLVDMIETLPSLPTDQPPSQVATLLLDLLHRSVICHRNIGEHQIAVDVERILVWTAEPMWACVGKWLNHGMQTDEGHHYGGPLSPEFFVMRTPDSVARVHDSAYWARGYRLQSWPAMDDSDPGQLLVPTCFGSLGPEILAAGKTVGLLRKMRVPVGFGPGNDGASEECNPAKWKTFGDATGAPHDFYDPLPIERIWKAPPTSIHLFDLPPAWTPPPPPPPRLPKSVESSDEEPPARPPTPVPAVNFPVALADHLSPLFRLLRHKLHRVIVEDVGLLAHLDAIEGLFLMRKGESIGDWSETLWKKLDSGDVWANPPILRLNLTDALEANAEAWIDPNFVFFTSKASLLRPSTSRASRKVESLENLSVDYEVPSPLHFVFTVESMQTRSRVFVFLLQLRRARYLLSTLAFIKRETWQGLEKSPEAKAFHGLRRRLSWVVQLLWEYVMTHVIDGQTKRFRAELEKTGSLDEMIPLHQYHVDRLEHLCLLDRKTEPLHKVVLEILNLSVLFSDTFHSFIAGETGTAAANSTSRSFISPRDASTAKVKPRRPSGRKKTELQELNEGLDEVDADLRAEREQAGDGSDDDYYGRGNSTTATEYTRGTGNQTTIGFISFAQKPFTSRIDKMTEKLGSAIRFLQVGSDTLAKSAVPPPSAEGGGADADRMYRWTRDMGDLRETWEILAWNLEAYV